MSARCRCGTTEVPDELDRYFALARGSDDISQAGDDEVGSTPTTTTWSPRSSPDPVRAETPTRLIYELKEAFAQGIPAGRS